jgi:hypothetical protein
MWSKPRLKASSVLSRAPKAHTADKRELTASLEQQTNYFEEVLVPPHRDAVFGNAAEPRHDAFVQRLI